MNNKLLTFALEHAGIIPVEHGRLADFEIPAADAADYMSDESRMRGRAERVFLPRSELDIVSVLKAASKLSIPVTVSCGRTGIAGGAVPDGGWLIGFERMSAFTGMSFDDKKRVYHLKCQPGLSLEAVSVAIHDRVFPGEESWTQEDKNVLAAFKQDALRMFAPDPTERTACIGGMTACNASGARTLYYGPTRNHVSRLRMILMDGSALDLKRGVACASNEGRFDLIMPDGKIKNGKIPEYAMPKVKNAAGYFVGPGMDLLDLFVGSEGTLGVFSEIEVELVKAPHSIFGAIGFFRAEKDAFAFVRAARENMKVDSTKSLSSPPVALEFFDSHSLCLLRKQKQEQGVGSLIPAFPDDSDAAVYIEQVIDETNDMDDAAEKLLILLESCGGDADTAWPAFTNAEIERLKNFRHALPEAVNQRIGVQSAACPGLTKLGTDFAAPDERLEDVFALYRSTFDDLKFEYVIFGHIGNNHLHVNILPRNMDEYEKGKSVYLELAKQIVEWGGTVSGEHGIGKLKKHLLKVMYGHAAVEEMKRLKAVFDPLCLLSRGNLF